MEESYASGALNVGGNVNFSDRSVLTAAGRLVESWAWGLDVDLWRAHLGQLTWPEVMRQLGMVCGAGEQIGPELRQGVEGDEEVGVLRGFACGRISWDRYLA